MRYPWLLIPNFGRGVSLSMVLSTDPIGQKGQIMARREFTANYNGEAIRPGEVMIPFEYTDLDAENCTNPECVKTLKVGNKSFKVIYKAVPEQWAKAGTSALTLVQNEALGHYSVPNSVSMDEMMDEYELSLDSAPSAEEVYEEADAISEGIQLFRDKVTELIEKSPKMGYAVLLVISGCKGEPFYKAMLVCDRQARRLYNQASDIKSCGLINFDTNSLSCSKSQHDEEYRAKAFELLDTFLSQF